MRQLRHQVRGLRESVRPGQPEGHVAGRAGGEPQRLEGRGRPAHGPGHPGRHLPAGGSGGQGGHVHVPVQVVRGRG